MVLFRRSSSSIHWTRPTAWMEHGIRSELILLLLVAGVLIGTRAAYQILRSGSRQGHGIIWVKVPNGIVLIHRLVLIIPFRQHQQSLQHHTRMKTSGTPTTIRHSSGQLHPKLPESTVTATSSTNQPSQRRIRHANPLETPDRTQMQQTAPGTSTSEQSAMPETGAVRITIE